MYTPIIVKPHTTLKSRECAGHFYNSALAELISVLAALRSAIYTSDISGNPCPMYSCAYSPPVSRSSR